MMQSLVLQHGSETVYDAGQIALGYPPTWAHSTKEVLAVLQRLKHKDETHE